MEQQEALKLERQDAYEKLNINQETIFDQGNIWSFSEKSSDKNKAIVTDKNVQLVFSHPAKGSYIVFNGEAEINLDETKTEEP